MIGCSWNYLSLIIHHLSLIPNVFFFLMIEQNLKLGKLVSIHGIAPAFLQRAVIVAVLSFVFFLAMLLAFYASQKLGYFLLSTAFLIVYIVTMFSWVMMRKNVLKIYENGLNYKNFTARWDEIKPLELKVTSRTLGNEKIECKITKKTGEQIVLSETIHDINDVIEKISDEVDGGGEE